MIQKRRWNNLAIVMIWMKKYNEVECLYDCKFSHRINIEGMVSLKAGVCVLYLRRLVFLYLQIIMLF